MTEVSVVIATYNYAPVLQYSVASALAQAHPPLEVLVVGDHCTDETADVVAGIGDERVRFVNLPERVGVQSGPNNEGIRLARGDVIAYLGHDDLWLPGHLGRVVAAIEGGADVAYEMVIDVQPDRENLLVPVTRYGAGMWIPPTVAAHHRRATGVAGGWRTVDELDRDPDRELWARMHRSGLRIEFVPRVGGVKLPASVRQGVYERRPVEEQARWAERIRTEPDLEASEGLPALFRSLDHSLEGLVRRRSVGELLGVVGREVRRRARRRLEARREQDGTGDRAGYRRVFEERLRYKGAADD